VNADLVLRINFKLSATILLCDRPLTRSQIAANNNRGFGSGNGARDSGSTLNIINLEEYERMTAKPTLRKPICNAYRFDSKRPINFLGRFKATLSRNGKSVEAEIHVVKYTSASPNILSYDTGHDLGIISIINSVEEDALQAETQKQYPELFSGEVGCLKDFELKLYEDKSVKPSKRFHYRILYHLQELVAEHLDKN